MSDQKFTYLAGINVRHSIAPDMHNYIAKSLGLPWTFKHLECPTIEFLMETFRRPDFAGGVVTMPYKTKIIEHLDGLDETAKTIGAVNNVFLSHDDGGAAKPKLIGSNTDWAGIYGCLTTADLAGKGVAQPALIIGAGGASRAAVYALHVKLGVTELYVINRDEGEVDALRHDTAHFKDHLNIIHLQTVQEAAAIVKAGKSPFYIVGTIPDFEPKTESELTARAVILQFLENKDSNGVVLDMCFSPRKTRLLGLARKNGWETVEGINIIGYQASYQYTLWAGKELASRIPHKEALSVLHKAADASALIN